MVGLLVLAWAVVVMHAGVAQAGMGHGPTPMSMPMSMSSVAAISQPGCVHPAPGSPTGPHTAMITDSCLTTPAVPGLDHTPTQALATVCFVLPRQAIRAPADSDHRTSRPPPAPDPVTELSVNRT